MEQYFFLHVPKTAGTSFRVMLQNQFDHSEIFPDEQMIRQLGGYPRYPELTTSYSERLKEIKLLVGHYPLIAYELLGPDTKVLSFFREPVQRILSFLNYYKSTDNRYLESTFEYIFDSEQHQIANLQVKLLSDGYGERGISRLEIAKKNLSKLDFIGISENFENSVLLAQKMFNWDLKTIKKVNVTASKEDLPNELIEKIREMNSEDCVLYEELKKRHLEQLQEYGIGDNPQSMSS